MTKDEFNRALMTAPFSTGELRLHDAEQRQVIEQLRKKLDLLKADDAERCTLIRDMEEEEQKKDVVIERQRQEIVLLKNTVGELGRLLATLPLQIQKPRKES